MTIMEVDVKLHYTNTGNPVDFPLEEPLVIELEGTDMTELEFVENSEQIDLWNYFRWTISSLRIYKPTNFVGRIISRTMKKHTVEKHY